MAIILARNFEGMPVSDFASEVRRRAASASRTGAYDFVYIVPTRRRVRELQRELVTDSSFGKPPVYTVELFAHGIFLLMSTGRRVISPSMQGMIVGQILSKGDFRFFRYASFRPGARKGIAPIGTVKKIVDQIDYLEENGVSPEDYRIMASASADSERLKLDEFARIYTEYTSRLGQEMVDGAGLVSLVNSGLAGSRVILEQRFTDTAVVFVEGFYNFKKPELDFLRLISSHKHFSFLVKLDCNESNYNLFRTMIATARDLTKRGFKRLEPDWRRGDATVGPQGEYLELHLFADDPLEKKADLSAKVFVTGVRDSLREAEFVAERIKEIVAGQSAQRLDRICVAAYLPQNYSRIFREVFRKYRIPSNITDRYTLDTNNTVNALLSFMEIKTSDYERGSLMRAITNRTIRVSEQFEPGKTGSIIYNAARLCRFERGLGTFKNSIDSQIRFLENLTRSDSDIDSGRTEHEVDTLKNAAIILDEVEQKLSAFNGAMTPEEFGAGMRALVHDLGVHENILKLEAAGVSTEVIEHDARALASFLDVLNELVGVESERGTGRLPAAMWLDSLRSALSLSRYNIRQKYGYGVYVTSLDEIRGLEFDYLFIVGLNEGELPARYSPEIFLPLKSQEENRETEPYLQRHLFYQALSSFRKRLYLVHPLQREEGHLVRSSFIDALTAIADVTALEDSPGSPGDSNIYSIHQLIESEPAWLRGGIPFPAHAFMSFLPPNLQRCREAETARYRDETESEFNGRVTDDLLLTDLEQRLGTRAFSAAQLESLSRCGFQYFAGRMLGISDVPDIETSLSPIERGAVLHRILYRFYSELAVTNELGSAKDKLELLLSVTRDILDHLNVSPEETFGHDLFEVEREMIIGTENTPGTLELFLSKVQARLSDYGFTPKQFEVGFGMKGGSDDAFSEPVVMGGVQVRGKIDRIDSSPDGLTVFDYKTSRINPSHQDVIRDRISPQLTVYLNALTNLLETSHDSNRVSGMAFVSINRERLLRSKDGSDLIEFIVRDKEGELRYNRSYESSKKMPAAAGYPATIDELLKRTEQFVKVNVDLAKSGKFNLTKFPPEKVCVYCPFDEACRIALTKEGFREET